MVAGIAVVGGFLIAGIGFAGSYAAVRELAEKKGFGDFARYFPIGIDAGICVLLALDLLLAWIRIPFPLLRQTAWLLTAATIAFNGAAAWPDPLGVGMHAVIPILFVVSVEAARHAVGRIADITADKHMEGVRLTRWLLSTVPTFLLWRRMKLWELRSYDQVIKLEQERLVYQARLRSRFGRAWRRKAPVESLMPLRLAKYGVPLKETAAEGLAAAGIYPTLLPRAERSALEAEPTPRSLTDRLDEEAATANPTDSSDRSRSDESASEKSVGSGFEPTPDPTDSDQPTDSSPDSDRPDHAATDPTDRPGASEPTDSTDRPDPTPQVSKESVGPPPPTASGPINRPDPDQSPDPAPPTGPTEREQPTDSRGRPVTPGMVEALEQAREKLADWPTSQLKEEPIRLAMGVGAKYARYIRDELKAERK
ncbi:DUF2637 domain-containing protein [Streptomyces sp. NBC_01304]|uniref:DUF2637 domain-containing protein n=1 Tax=Streptomyces sp. NBC_01304 TaxID=2903818 RepID=UPI002E13BDC1|nr:DUF2637 domain-containing protein [Streptomyces sp. NBC_01304]